jgi:hypothetical protein
MSTDFRDPFDTIVNHPFDEALSQRYLVYALSTITARSLPDLRDGLKPVHRRLLWAMRLLRMEPAGAAPDVLTANPARNTTPYKKCARVVGDVIGKYHPHGDHRSMTRWCAWRRISRCARRWSTVRAISAILTAITRRLSLYRSAADAGGDGPDGRAGRRHGRFPPDL